MQLRRRAAAKRSGPARGETLTGNIAWTAIGQYSVQLTQFVTVVVLSRLLSPADFGRVAMITVITGFVAIFADIGVGSAVVQKRDLSDSALDGLFWLTAGAGAGLAGLVLAVAPLIAKFYQIESLTGICRLLALVIACHGLAVVPVGLLRREMRFRTLAGIEVTAALAAATTGLLLAFSGAGYWALATQILVAVAVRGVLAFGLCGRRPRLRFSFRSMKESLAFSIYVMGFNSISYWARNADNALVGRFFGSAALGYYSHAYGLMLLPMRLLNTVFDPVMHPVMAARAGGVEQVRLLYFKATRAIALISVPVAAGMWVAAELLIKIVWGPGWEPAIPIFRVLGVLAALQPVVSTSGAVFLACDRTKLYFWFGAVTASVMVAAMLVGLRWGIIGVAVGYAISYTLTGLPTLYFVVTRLLEVRFAAFARQQAAPILVGVLVWTAATVTKQLVAPSFTNLWQLVAIVAVDATVLAISVLWFERALVKSLMQRLWVARQAV